MSENLWLPLLLSIWLALPGVLLLAGLKVPEARPLDTWITGSVVGLAAAVYLLVLTSYVSLSLFTPVWSLLSLAAVIYWWKRGGTPLLARPDAVALLFGGTLLLLSACRLPIVLWNELPHGWDPSFHCLLAHKIYLRDSMIYDWRPFEEIALNYPVGSFMLLAWIERLTGLECHLSHKVLMSIHGVLTAALLYVLGSRVGRSREAGLWTAATYGLWAVGGNLHTVIYGGYPNQLALLFVIAAYQFFCFYQDRPYTRALVVLLLAAAFLTHHHVMLTTFFAGAMLTVALLVKRRWAESRRLLSLALAALLFCAFYMLPYLLKAGTLASTHVATYPEAHFGPLASLELMGYLFLFACLVGFLFGRRRGLSVEERSVAAVCVSLLGLFVGFDWVFRGLRWWLTGVPYAAFTPWRFLTDAAPFLAYFSGLAVLRLRERVSVLSLPLAFLLVAAGTLTNWQTYRTLWSPNYAPEVIRASRWIKANTPPDTVVLTAANWVPYFSWRRTGLTPIPTSEPANAESSKVQMIESILAGSVPSPQEGPMVVDLRYGEAWPGTRLLWKDDAPAGRRANPMVVVQLLDARALLPNPGWSPRHR